MRRSAFGLVAVLAVLAGLLAGSCPDAYGQAPGDAIQVEYNNAWYPGTIEEIKPYLGANHFRVKYTQSGQDEWVAPNRVARRDDPKPPPVGATTDAASLAVGQEVSVEYDGQWYPASLRSVNQVFGVNAYEIKFTQSGIAAWVAPNRIRSTGGTPDGASGEVTKNGRSMPIRDVVAVFKAADNELTVVLVPMPLTPEQREKVIADGGSAVYDFPTPDPAVWEKCPHVQLSLALKGAGEFDTPDGVASYWVLTSGIVSTTSSSSVAVGGPEGRKTLAKIRYTGGLLELVARGEQTVGTDKIHWDVRLKSKVTPRE